MKRPVSPRPLHEENAVDLTDHLSDYLSSTMFSVDPGDRNQHVSKNMSPRARDSMQYYDGMSAFLFTPGNPSVRWFCHADNRMHEGIKASAKYMSFLQVIATHDKEKEQWDDKYVEMIDASTSVGKSLPCTPRARNGNGNGNGNGLKTGIPRIHSVDSFQRFSCTELPTVRVSWYGITNGKAITSCQFDRETNRIQINVEAYTREKSNLGMHSKVPVRLPSFYFAQEGGFQLLHPGAAGRQCTVFLDSPLSDREWKREFGGHECVHVRSDAMYCIDEAYIDMEEPLDPLREVVMD